MGWRGAALHATGFQLHGRGLTAFYAGNINAVSNIEATPSTRLFDLWFEQALFDDKLAIRIGQLRVDYSGEFLSVGPGGIFISANYGWPSFTANNLPAGGPTFPLASPGVRVKVSPNDKMTLLLGAYNDDPVGPNCDGDPQVCNDHGLEFRLKDDPLLIAELQLKYHLGAASALPGVFKIGAFKDYGKFDSQRFDDAGLSLASPLSSGTPMKIGGNHGLYGIIEQQILQPDVAHEDRGLFCICPDCGTSFRSKSDRFLFGGRVEFCGFGSRTAKRCVRLCGQLFANIGKCLGTRSRLSTRWGVHTNSRLRGFGRTDLHRSSRSRMDYSTRPTIHLAYWRPCAER